MAQTHDDRRRRRAVAIGSSAAILAIAGLGWAFLDGDGSEPEAGQAPVVGADNAVAVPEVSVVIIDADTSAPDPATIAPSTTASVAPPPDTAGDQVSVAPGSSAVPNGLGDQAPAYVVIEDGTVYVRGAVPDRKVGDFLVGQARAFGDGEAIDQLAIEPGTPVGDNLPLFVPAAALFSADGAVLSPGSDELTSQVAEAMALQPTARLRIRGHTDDLGTEEYNLELSRQRVAAVAAALARRGVGADRVILEAIGEAEPVADNATAAGRAQNRRVELILVGPEA